jgi:acyl-CoA synthetase (NDP forming)
MKEPVPMPGVATLLADDSRHFAAAAKSAAAEIKPYIADEAKRIVSGARRAAYGTPEDNFARIARFWEAYFKNTGRDISVTAADVSPLMRLMKEARMCETPDHLDSFIDLVGYTLTGAEVNGVKIPVDGTP